ncbi:TIGR03750 family conjugal transfer protein [Pseudomonas cichorii]|uniref:TIGR03750 family conjugal transfer protein n=1 Tax=Pseudomonas serbiensis TaxID=3064350 RepID=A0ABT9CQS3_9PSED|nr:TIGR03750 family conjugal transfer protein [Pseudomonas sp. KFB-138]MBX8588608.1 TIGR03750 family conjugal transfer protein [Pseudomonas cichorii]MDO7927745.1 TIGR03750 family conjugal transfer protein [Pseudomonas sp. KFB-138]
MSDQQDQFEDGTLRFLPSRLNTQPVVIGGLTADEMWMTISGCAGTGFIVGIPLAFFTTPAMPVILALAGGTVGLLVAARILRRWKRGRPETWLYRQAQWLIAQHGPRALNAGKLVVRSGAWTSKRMVQR